MCGIFGDIGNNYHNIGLYFSNYLNHRGPNFQNNFYDHNKKMSLGHTRLSIIDLTDLANQPMIDKTNNYVITYNGEIYNYKELRNELKALGYKFYTVSDTEVLLTSYIHWGEDFLKKLRGMFSFCIFNRKNQTLFMARDRFGIKPLIYSFLNNQFIFSSELKPFLKTNYISKQLDQKSINDFFQYGSIQQPNTILKGVYQLLPGHSMTVKFDKSHVIKKYYDYVEESKKLERIETYEDAVLKVREQLEIATQYHLVSDVDVAALLSSGIDSTALVALMKKNSDSQINTYTLGFEGKTNVTDETERASLFSKKLGLKHKTLKINQNYIEKIFDDFLDDMDQPSVDGLNTYIISSEISKKYKVALSGLGADEIFAGYDHFANISNYNNKKSYYLKILKLINKVKPNRFTRKFSYMGETVESSLNNVRSLNQNLSNILNNHQNFFSNYRVNNNISAIQRISKGEIDNYLLNTLLRDSDIMTMAHSLELRPAFLDHKLVELVFSIDDSIKLRSDFPKKLLIDCVKDIVPIEFLNKKKVGFEMPFSIWTNGKLKSKLIGVFNNQINKSIFKNEFLNRIEDRLINKKTNNSDWLTLIFLSWVNRYNIDY